MPKKNQISDPALGELTDNFITKDFSVYQRLKGHRFSSDDVTTAYIAYRHAEARGWEPDTIIDLGCGLGSVLIVLAWKFRNTTFWGVEAQAQSFALLQKNIARNGLNPRVHIKHGDLREDESVQWLPKNTRIITGTPPYFPIGTATDAVDEQRAYARMEYRGGVEAYMNTAAQLLSSDGVFTLCGDADAEKRVVTEAAKLGLHMISKTDFIARVGKAPLFSVWALSYAVSPFEFDTLTARDAQGEETHGAALLRIFAGFLPEKK